MGKDLSGLVQWEGSSTIDKGVSVEKTVTMGETHYKSLLAEIERLREDIATRTMNWLKNNVTDKGEILRAEIKAATAEAKLRDAVDVIKSWQSCGCPYCHGDCAGANPPVSLCLMHDTAAFLATMEKLRDPIPQEA
jgi:hypothetical protein